MRTMPDTLPFALQAILSRHQEQVESVDDERDTGDGYWIYLKDGWVFDHSTTFIHETSIRSVAAAFKRVAYATKEPA